MTLPPHLKEQMHRKQLAPPPPCLWHTLTHCHAVRRELRSWGLPGFLPYSKKPHRSIKLHLLHPDGRPPRTQVPAEPGTLLANVSEGRLGVTLEPRVPAYGSATLHMPLLGTRSTQLQVYLGNYNIKDRATRLEMPNLRQKFTILNYKPALKKLTV